MPDDAAERDLPLREDTRLLGRVLGDVVRTCSGDDTFERVEAVRQTAIRFRRAVGDEAARSRAELAAILNSLSIAQTLHVVRAFSYFSHLANLADGAVLASHGVMNPQIRFGEDLMSRVSYAMMHPEGAAEMTQAVRTALKGLIATLALRAGVPRDT